MRNFKLILNFFYFLVTTIKCIHHKFIQKNLFMDIFAHTFLRWFLFQFGKLNFYFEFKIKVNYTRSLRYSKCNCHHMPILSL